MVGTSARLSEYELMREPDCGGLYLREEGWVADRMSSGLKAVVVIRRGYESCIASNDVSRLWGTCIAAAMENRERREVA